MGPHLLGKIRATLGVRRLFSRAEFESADFDQSFVRQLGKPLQNIALDDPGRGLVASAEFFDQVGHAHRRRQLAPDFTADSAQSVTATARQAHEYSLTGHVRGHWIGCVTYRRCETYFRHC